MRKPEESIGVLMAEIILFFMEIKLWNVCQGVHYLSSCTGQGAMPIQT